MDNDILPDAGYEVTSPQSSYTNGKAIVSLVLSIASFPMSCLYGCGIVPAILAIVLGFVARREIRESEGAQKGEGLALAGIVVGGLVIALVLLLIGLVVVLTLLGGPIEEIFSDIAATLEAPSFQE